MMRTVFVMLTMVFLIVILLSRANAADIPNLTLLDGSTVPLDRARDKPLYLKFWATWCGACRAQMPHLESLHIKHHDEIDVIGVNFGFNDTKDLVIKFQRDFKLTVPIAYDPLGRVVKFLNVFVVPYSILIDRQGNIVHSGFGIDGVDDAIGKLIGNAP